MRGWPVLAAVLLLSAPAASASPRDFLLRKILARATHVSAPATTPAVRRRATLPPKPSACPDAILTEADVSALTASGDSVFYTDYEKGLLRVSKSGGTPVSIALNPSLTFGPLAADASSVYYITADNDTTGSIYSVPRSGGTPKLLATNLPAPIDIRLDSTSIYWLNLGTIMGDAVAADGSVERMLKDGSQRQKLAGNLSAPAAFDIDASDIYVSETGLGIGSPAIGLRRISQSGGSVTSLLDDHVVYALAVSGSDVFYSGVSIDNQAVVARMSKSGGAPQVLAADIIALTVIVRDERVYFVAIDQNLNITIDSVTTTGEFLRILKSVNLESASIDADDCAVYFAGDFALQRTPR